MTAVGQARLRTARLLLVPLADEHLEHEVELDADPDVMRYLGDGRPRTRAQVERQHAARLAAGRRVPGLGFWVGFLHRPGDPVAVDEPGDSAEPGSSAEPGPFVGWWILEPPERPDQVRPEHGPAERQAELGYRLLPRFWRRGLASEGARELLRHGFDDLGLTRVYAETMAVNAASRATMSAVGLRHARTFHLQWDEPIPGAEHGEVEYALTREQWRCPATR